MGCFTDHVKFSHALVRDPNEAINEVKLLGEHEEESSQKITELEALCKKLREDTKRLEEEKATHEGMLESHNELLMEITREMGLDRMGEDEDEEEKEEDADDGGDSIAPLLPHHHLWWPLLPCLRRSMKKALWRWSLSKKLHEVVLVDAEPEMPQLCLYHALLRDYEENLLRLEDDFDDLDDDPSEDQSDMDE
jgi:DnaJ-domain-containing protein 1